MARRKGRVARAPPVTSSSGRDMQACRAARRCAEHRGRKLFRVEPTTPPQKSKRLSGAEGNRTPDLCIANAALSQLSYNPGFAERRL